MKNKEVNLLDILIILAKKKVAIISIVFSITLLALIISLVWPKSYDSTAEFIYNKPSAGGAVSGILNSIMPMGGAGSSKLGPEQALVILKSRKLKDYLIEQHDLGKYYEKELKEDVYEKINSNILLEDNREGGFGFNPIISITLTYREKEPQKAKDIVDSMLFYVDSLITELNQKANIKSMQLIEDQYQQNLEDLKSAENALNEFQNTYGVIQVDQQAEQLIEIIAELKQKSVELEIQIDNVQSISSNNVALLQKLRNQKRSVDSKFNELVQKSEVSLKNAATSGQYSLFDYPDLILKYGRLYREVEVQNKVFEYIYPLWIQTKSQLNDTYSGIQIIDPPRVPTYKSAPKRAIIVIAGFLFSCLLALLYVGFNHFKNSNSDQAEKIIQFKNELLGK